MYRIYLSIIYLLVCWMCVLNTYPVSANIYPSYIAYGPADGLASSETYDVLQDKQGRIWVATDRGVSRYDGYNWKSFTTKDGLTDNTVLKLYQDGFNRIWFLPISNKLCYYKKGKIYSHSASQKIAEKYKGILRAFYVDKKETLYLGLLHNGIIAVQKSGKIQELNENLPDNITYYIKKIDGQLVAALNSPKTSHTDSILLFDSNKKKHILYTSYHGKNSHVQITHRVRKNKSTLFYFTGNIVEIADNCVKIHPSKDEILGIHEDLDSCLWISYRHGEIRKFQPNESPTSTNYESLFSGEVISSIIQDNSGSFWLTTLNKGVFFVPSPAIKIQEINPKYTISTIAPDTINHTLYVGYTNGNIDLFKEYGKEKLRESGEHVGNVFSILSINDTTLICGRNQTLIVQNKKVHVLDNLVYARHLFKFGSLFCGMTNSTIFSVDPIKRTINKFPGQPIRGELLYKDAIGRTLVGDHNGLYQHVDSNFTKAYPQYDFLNIRISGITEDKNHNLIVSTIGSGIFIISKDSKVLKINHERGLPSDIVNCIYFDGECLWAGTSNGIARIDWNSRSISTINTHHGLPTNEIRWITSVKGKIWAASSKSLICIDAQKLIINRKSTTPIINSIKIADKTIPAKPVSIAHNKMPLRINFSSVNFKLSNKILYRYKVSGIFNETKYTNQTFVEFLSVPPGDYTFEVASRNEDGYWSEKSALFHFSVTPPFYSTWFFYLACFFIFSVLSILVTRKRINSIRNKNKLATDLLTYRQKSLQLQMNPHFMSNFLISLQSFVLKENRHEATKYISKFSKYMRLVLDNVRSENIPLKQEVDAMNRYLELECLRFRNVFDYKIEIEDTIQADKIVIPSMLIQPFLENAVIHAFTESIANGIIIIHIKKHLKYLEVMIDDNGGGINPDKKDSEHKSAGTSITKKRLELISEQHGTPFRFELIEKKIIYPDQSGVRIIINIPYFDSYVKNAID